jgi:aminopeptidase YwaD
MLRLAITMSLATLLLALADTPIRAAHHRTITAQTADLVRSTYDENKALETVAYLDQYIRWPGNRGFDAAIDHIAERLETAGFVREDDAADGTRLTYRVEEYPMDFPAWEPLDATVTLVGEDSPLLSFTTNRNMLATRSHGTVPGGVTAKLVDVGRGSPAELDAANVAGKIVIADGELSSLVQHAIVERGAIGVLVYDLPEYLQPKKNKHSIQFRGINKDLGLEDGWAIALSFDARERLHSAMDDGAVQLNVMTRVQWTENAVERTIVADIHGDEAADERFVFSAHVQEPGANDNASGVGAQLEMAAVAARLVRNDRVQPKRTMTFLWGDEIRSTRRYVRQNEERAQGILWGMSVDMVGEDTTKTGGTFLIEKMPDPSAIWTRGEDQHSAWGGDPMTKEDMTPHYFNDLVLGRALEQAATNGWVVKTNPFEGGSDHVPFLDAGIPALLLWHFTDQFYHTDGDRLANVSVAELKNTGVTALVSGLTMTTADGMIARGLVEEVSLAARTRLNAETDLSIAAIADGADVNEQLDIIETWAEWYDAALASMDDIEVGGSSAETRDSIESARKVLRSIAATRLEKLTM